jgi:redox-sensitive bicupin YhaK (pirin superfamily)
MRFIERNMERGESNLGWLASRFSYSFAEYRNPARMHFGALRVLNDDVISPESGFPMHRHAHMEIVTVMLSGTLTHTDSLGNSGTLSAGEVQAMSAGPGILHSEWNASPTTSVELLQIWIVPREDVPRPTYAQKYFDEKLGHNNFQILVSGSVTPDTLTIAQDAEISRGVIDKGVALTIPVQSKTHGLFLFVISGTVSLGEDVLHARDAIEITDESMVTLRADESSDVLCLHVPLLSTLS